MTARLTPPSPRLILAGLSVTQLLGWGIFLFAFTVLATRISEDTGWEQPHIMAAYSSALVMSALAGIPVGKLLDRSGPRWVMTLAAAMASLTLLVVAWAPSIWIFAAGWLLTGMAMAGTLSPPAFAAVTRWYAHRRVFALTILTLMMGLSSVFFGPIAEYLAHYFTWRETYTLLAALFFVVAVPTHGLLLNRPWRETHFSATASRQERRDLDAAEAQYAKSVIRSRPFGMAILGLALGAIAVFGSLINLVPMLIERGVSSADAAWVLSIGGLGQVIGRIFYAALASRLSVVARSAAIYGTVVLTVSLLALDLTLFIPLLVMSFLAGLGRGNATLIQATAVTDRWGPRAFGQINGMLYLPVMLSFGLSPWIGASLASFLGSYERMFLVLAGCAALAVVCLFASIPPHERTTLS